MDTLLDESNDSTSEDEWVIGTENRVINRQREHKYWSTAEVLKLVEGVSKYGVGRWADIKKIYFGSSVHRGPADLKDKWRNLVNASCRRSQRGIGEKYEEILRQQTQTKSEVNQIQAYYETVGGEKKRVFGLGSQAQLYYGPNLRVSPNSDASSSVSPSECSVNAVTIANNDDLHSSGSDSDHNAAT